MFRLRHHGFIAVFHVIVGKDIGRWDFVRDLILVQGEIIEDLVAGPGRVLNRVIVLARKGRANGIHLIALGIRTL